MQSDGELGDRSGADGLGGLEMVLNPPAGLCKPCCCLQHKCRSLPARSSGKHGVERYFRAGVYMLQYSKLGKRFDNNLQTRWGCEEGDALKRWHLGLGKGKRSGVLHRAGGRFAKTCAGPCKV